jgi:hypothetical protein
MSLRPVSSWRPALAGAAFLDQPAFVLIFAFDARRIHFQQGTQVFEMRLRVRTSPAGCRAIWR